MKRNDSCTLQFLVFFLVGAAFTTIYITQPVLPVLQLEFGVNEARASLTISMVILGIALANLPFGILSDRYPIRPILLTGGLVVAACGSFCALTTSLGLLIVARFVQGLFIPSLTTCLAAQLAKSLPAERLNVVMGSYVSATVAGGLGGRLLGGWIHPPLHWRYAFGSACLLVLAATIATVMWLPQEEPDGADAPRPVGFLELIKRAELFRIYLVAFGGFFVFSSVFNFLPFYLSGPPFGARTEIITLMYLSYVVGIIVGPLAGKLSNRIGNGTTMALGAVVFAGSIGVTLLKSMTAMVVALVGVCAGFFAIHAAAAGSLNRKVTSSRGRANSLYILFYYLGGAAGITLSGHVYMVAGWPGVAGLGGLMLLIPLTTGLMERSKGCTG
ncbi:MAG TPA: MFS transporter [Syntrophobacteraceae bacterium]|nr:MFS transporter [Syntrophobacteraceae bacterium]